MATIYNYGLDGYFVWYKPLIYIPLLIAGLWFYKKFVIPESCFSISNVFKKYGLMIVIISASTGYSYYWAHRCVPVTYVCFNLVCLAMSFIIMERSIYD